MSALFRRFAWWRRRRITEEELRQELEFHLAEESAERQDAGVSAEEARRQAHLDLGNRLLIREDVRTAWSWPRFERIVQDLRFGLRGLRRSPAFTVTTVLTLAIGIGATSAIFSVINGVLLKPLPFPDSDRLIALVHQTRRADQSALGASRAMYFTYREHNQTFESVALWNSTTASITSPGDPEEVQSLVATYEFLPTLGVPPVLGRAFTEADDQSSSRATVMLSYDYWQRRFGGVEQAIGQMLTIDGVPHEVIGVLPPRFRFLQQPAEIVMSLRPNRATAYVPSIEGRGIARLRRGVTLAQASADVARMIPILIDSFPVVPGLTKEAVKGLQLGPNLRILKQDIVGDLDTVLWVLMGTMGLLLMVACANVATLQLVRTDAREHELAVRAALGAGWGTIAWNILIDSSLLGLLGGALGLALASVSVPALVSMAGQELPSVLEVTIDPRVIVFTIATSLGAGLLFGLVPVVKYARSQVATMLSGVGRSHSLTRERHRARHALVVVQIALTLVLLVASGLMIRTFQSLRAVDPGFTDPEHIQTLRLSVSQSDVPAFDRVVRMQRDIQDRLSELPGVQSVGFGTRLPMVGNGPTGPFFLEDQADAAPLSLVFRYTSPRFFTTLGTPFVAGRDFEWSDYAGDHQVAIVSEGVARHQWGSPTAAIGKRVRRDPKSPWIEVVGVAGDIRHHGVEEPAPDTIYMTSTDRLAPFMSRDMFFFIRGQSVGTPGFLADLERIVWSVNRNAPLGSVQTMDEVYRRSMARTSLMLTLLAITAAMALSLGLVGIYGLIGYVLTERRREIGVRLMLGAEHGALKRMLFNQVLVLVIIGVVLGVGGAAAVTRLMRSLLFDVSALDPAAYVAGVMVLLMTAAVAGYLPVRRVTRIAPIQSLREG